MANSRNTVSVILRKQTLNATGVASLALQFFVGGNRKLKSLNIQVRPCDFDVDKQLVNIKGDPVKTKDCNTLIKSKVARAERIFLNAEVNRQHLTFDNFWELFEGSHVQGSFTAFVQKEIRTLEKAALALKGAGKKMKPTKRTLQDYNLMLRYAHESVKTTNISFGALNTEFLEKFERYLKKKGEAVNTIAKHHKNLKKFINLAIQRKKFSGSPYETYKVKKAKSLRDWLTPDELESLFNLYNSRQLKPEWQRVLRYFLFSCVGGGLRISELIELVDANKVGENLVVYTEKGSDYERKVIVPFSEVGLALWRDRDLATQKKRVFDCVSDQKSNKIIKKVCRIAGIDKTITMHIARHSFATNYIVLGGRLEMLNDILGHSKIDTTMIYVHMAESYKQKSEQMRNFDRFFKVEKRKIIPIMHKIAS